jgi:hypothetical protein
MCPLSLCAIPVIVDGMAHPVLLSYWALPVRVSYLIVWVASARAGTLTVLPMWSERAMKGMRKRSMP